MLKVKIKVYENYQRKEEDEIINEFEGYMLEVPKFDDILDFKGKKFSVVDHIWEISSGAYFDCPLILCVEPI